MNEENKICIVTGAAGAIGRTIATAFLTEGYHVIGQDIRPMDITHDAFTPLYFDLADYVRDAQKQKDIHQKLTALISGKACSVLINNAAIQLLGSTEEIDHDTWQTSLNVNLLAPFFLSQFLLPDLKKNNGNIVNISSIHTHLTKPGFVLYATTKAALSTMTRAMAVDIGPDVQINAIEPAAIDTPMLSEGFAGDAAALEALKNFHPQQKIGTPAEVGKLVLFLCSGQVNFMHGSCITLDGAISSRLHDPS